MLKENNNYKIDNTKKKKKKRRTSQKGNCQDRSKKKWAQFFATPNP